MGTVAEQMLYEIGDPQAYILPDVVCDFSGVRLESVGHDRVRVSGATGRGAPAAYKVSATWADGFRAGHVWTMVGRDADTKAQRFAEQVFARAGGVLERAGLAPFTETSCEIIGSETHFGAARQTGPVREVDVKLAVKHPAAAGIGIFLKEMTGLALTAPPGLTGFAGARAKPSPVVRLFSFLIPKSEVSIDIHVEGEPCGCNDPEGGAIAERSAPEVPQAGGFADPVHLPLESLAWGRSGDKGNKANIGIIARHADFLPYIGSALTEEKVAHYFAHFLAPGARVERFYLPGPHAFNFLLHEVLGGGGIASLRVDPQGKGYAQLLLAEAVPIPRSLAEHHGLL